MKDKKRGSLSSPSKWIYFSSLLASFVSTAVRVSAIGLTIAIIVYTITTCVGLSLRAGITRVFTVCVTGINETVTVII